MSSPAATPRHARPRQSNQTSRPCSGKTAWRVAMTARSTGVLGVVAHLPRAPPDRPPSAAPVAHPGRAGAPEPLAHVLPPVLAAPRCRAGSARARRWRSGASRRAARRRRPRSRRRRAPPTARRRPRAPGRAAPRAASRWASTRQRQVRQRVLHVGVAAVLGDQHVGREGPHERRAPRRGTRAASRRRRCPGGSATLTAVPSASGPPMSAGQPVPGKSARPLSCSEIVSTRGSSQKIRSTPSPWCTSTST